MTEIHQYLITSLRLVRSIYYFKHFIQERGAEKVFLLYLTVSVHLCGLIKWSNCSSPFPINKTSAMLVKDGSDKEFSVDQ